MRVTQFGGDTHSTFDETMFYHDRLLLFRHMHHLLASVCFHGRRNAGYILVDIAPMFLFAIQVAVVRFAAFGAVLQRIRRSLVLATPITRQFNNESLAHG